MTALHNPARGLRPVLLVVLGLAVVMAACGGGGEGGEQATPGPTATAVSLTPLVSASVCRPTTQFPAEPFGLDVTARWRGSDRVVIEGEVRLPGPGDVRYFICQDGQLAAFLRPAVEPTLENGKIKAESKVTEGIPGPPFNPDGEFEVVLAVVGVTGVPFFVTTLPVEGKPD